MTCITLYLPNRELCIISEEEKPTSWVLLESLLQHLHHLRKPFWPARLSYLTCKTLCLAKAHCSKELCIISGKEDSYHPWWSAWESLLICRRFLMFLFSAWRGSFNKSIQNGTVVKSWNESLQERSLSKVDNLLLVREPSQEGTAPMLSTWDVKQHAACRAGAQPASLSCVMKWLAIICSIHSLWDVLAALLRLCPYVIMQICFTSAVYAWWPYTPLHSNVRFSWCSVFLQCS